MDSFTLLEDLCLFFLNGHTSSIKKKLENNSSFHKLLLVSTSNVIELAELRVLFELKTPNSNFLPFNFKTSFLRKGKA